MGGRGGLTPQSFLALSDGDVAEALADFEDQPDKVRIHPEISIKSLTVECGYVWTCEHGEMVKTDEIAHYRTTETDATSLKIGNRKDSPSKETAAAHIQEAKAKLEELLEAEGEYDDFECN